MKPDTNSAPTPGASQAGQPPAFPLVAGSNPEPLAPELEELRKANEIAETACEERQPIPSEGVSNRLIAEACERIGEAEAKIKAWCACAHAHRMACWYYRKALAE